jgi:hypothetical protein
MKRTHKLEDGTTIVTHAPSLNFNPIGATAAEQVANGFPAMPHDPHHRARYEKVWERLKSKFHYIEPTFRVNKERKHGLNRRANGKGTSGVETSGNWSGGVVYAPSGDSFKWLEGDWVVPAVDAPTQNEWYYGSSWIGIDGDATSDVFQAGVQAEVYTSGSSVTTNYYACTEWYPASEVQITNFPVSPGDMITMILCSSGAGATEGTVYWTNVTTGASTNVTFTAPTGVKLVGNCAEWIMEGNAPLPDYGEIFFSNCQAVLNNNVTVNGGSGDTINMTNAAGQVISEGIVITPTVIQCLYTGPRP